MQCCRQLKDLLKNMFHSGMLWEESHADDIVKSQAQGACLNIVDESHLES